MGPLQFEKRTVGVYSNSAEGEFIANREVRDERSNPLACYAGESGKARADNLDNLLEVEMIAEGCPNFGSIRPATHLKTIRETTASGGANPKATARHVASWAEELENRGWLLIKSYGTDKEALLDLSQRLGDIQRHERSDKDGVTEIAPKNDQATQFRGLSADEFPPHTDGSYLNFCFRMGSNHYALGGPPKAIVIQCVRPARKGGENLIIDGKLIANAMRQQEPELFQTLTQPCLNIVRGNYAAIMQPVFSQVNSCWRIRFRSDEFTNTLIEKSESIVRFVSDFIENPQFTEQIQLSEGDILVIDNFRVLHGRAPIAGDTSRHLRRTWIADDVLTIFKRLRSASVNQEYFDAIHKYRSSTSKHDHSSRVPWNAGFVLNRS